MSKSDPKITLETVQFFRERLTKPFTDQEFVIRGDRDANRVGGSFIAHMLEGRLLENSKSKMIIENALSQIECDISNRDL